MFDRARRKEKQETIERLYGAVVAQARLPYFYTAFAVPDTIEGRFDLLVLHVHLLFRRLAADGAEGRALGQGVFDRFVEDMDASLRELGVGDLAVPKRMRGIGEAFYGRAGAYDAALARPDDDLLVAALLRNVYAGDGAALAAARGLARYVRRAQRALAGRDAGSIMGGVPGLPAPQEA